MFFAPFAFSLGFFLGFPLTLTSASVTNPPSFSQIYHLISWSQVKRAGNRPAKKVIRSGSVEPGIGVHRMSAMPSRFGKWGPNAVKATAPLLLQRELPSPTTWGSTDLDWP
ncbi:hypothetical protein QBC39DRAFT_7369 [Podospora conica]|nr:hypothetical protein QBC39DRAFT_7369 [Schizothecium conicum]